LLLQVLQQQQVLTLFQLEEVVQVHQHLEQALQDVDQLLELYHRQVAVEVDLIQMLVV
tara:strand:- start:382 stop:555 length:174 start_codon:yes stop_codon:yes gene_type:complete